MGVTTAVYSALSGMNANQTRVETIGNNIANVNTTAFKGSRTLFQTQYAQTLSMGTPPSESSGGTNPMQVGLGTMVGSTQRMLTGNSLETTGIPSDLAVEGAGYFLVDSPAGRRFYTRDGSFVLNANHELVTADGNYVQGFGVDANFQVVPGQLQRLTVPMGQMAIARATQNVRMDGDLSAAETIATAGSQHTTQALRNGGGAAADGNTALTDLRSAARPGAALFAANDVITVTGATRGDRVLPVARFTVGTDGNTLGDFANWMQNTLGIQTGQGLPGTPGVTVENGALVIRSNWGEPNAIQIQTSHLTSSGGEPLPFQFTQTGTAQGTGLFTSYTVYDSLGNPVPVQVTFVLESTPNTGPVWRYYLESPAQQNTPRSTASGTLTFDTNGRFVSAAGNQLQIDRGGTGAATPLQITLDFSQVNGLSTAESNVVMATQDGFPPGTLTTFAVGNDGTISGVFSNGLTRTLGQVALATFSNEAGLVAEKDNLFSAGPNSGSPQVLAPGTLGAGEVRGGALELSNVELAREFIGLITASTAFQANSRVISVASEMLDQLLVALR